MSDLIAWGRPRSWKSCSKAVMARLSRVDSRAPISFPPALSPLRTSSSGGKPGKVRGDDKGRSQDGEYLKRNRWFESGSLQRRVRLSPGAAVEGREPRLSARLCAAGLATGST